VTSEPAFRNGDSATDSATGAPLVSAAPSALARALALASILVAGLCGGLIGYAFVDLQCTGSCSTEKGVGLLVGALCAAIGTAIVAVLALRAMAEWNAKAPTIDSRQPAPRTRSRRRSCPL